MKLFRYLFILISVFTINRTTAQNGCANAIDVTAQIASSTKIAGTTAGANKTITGNYNYCGTPSASGQDVWYKFTTPATLPVCYTFNLNRTSGGGLTGSMEMDISTGTCGALSSVIDKCECRTNIDFTSLDISPTNWQPNTTYYVRINNQGAGGTFTLAIQMVTGLAANDECAGAFNLTNGVNELYLGQGGCNYSANSTDPLCVVNTNTSSGLTAWYKFTPTANGQIQLGPVLSDCDNGVGTFNICLYSGTCGNIGNSIGSGLHPGTGCGGGSATTFLNGVAGTTYYVLIQSFNNSYNCRTGFTLGCPSCTTATAPPTVEIKGGTICQGECMDLTAIALDGTPGYTYTWSPNIGSTQGPHAVCPTTTTTYTVTITDAIGRTATDTATVVVTGSPNLLPNPSFETYSTCPTTQGQVNLASPWTGLPNGAAASDYFVLGCPNTWTASYFKPGSKAMVGFYTYWFPYNTQTNDYREYVQAPLASPLVAGTSYCVSFYVRHATNMGGINTTTDRLGAYLSVAPVSPPSPPGNANIPVIPQVQSTPGTPIAGGGWVLVKGNFVATGGESYITFGNFYDNANTTLSTNTGNDRAYYFLDDVSIVETSSSCSVCLPAAPIVAVNDTGVCSGSCATLTASATGTGPLTYSWSPGGATTSSIQACPTATSLYTVTVTDSTGATATDTATVRVNALPVITVTADTSVCGSSSVQLNALGATTFTWSPAASLSNSTIANPIATPSGTTTYTVVGTDANGCSGSATVKITVNPAPVLKVSNDTTICIGSSVQLTVEGAATYQWNPGATLNNPNIANPVATPVSTTTYTVTGTDAKGCTATAVVTVTVNTVPNVSFAPFTNSICASAAPFALTGGSPAGGTYSGPGVSNNTFDPASAGVGTHTLTYTYSNGICSGSATATITVDPAGAVTISPIPTQCLTGGPVTLSGSPAGGTFSGPGVTGNTFNPSAVGVGTYTITYTVTSSACLSNTTASTSVTVSPQPAVTVTAAPDPTLPCLPNYTIYLGIGPQAITLTANSNPAATSYQWYLNGVAIAGATNQTYGATATGNYNVIATINGCPSDSSLTNHIEVHVVDARCKNDLSKIAVCHKAGNSGKFSDLCVEATGAMGHISHGDCLGKCGLTWRIGEGGNVAAGLQLNTFPNPFTGSAVIEFEVAEDANVSLEVYNIQGALVAKLFEGFANADRYSVVFDGAKLPSGIYNAKLVVGDNVEYQKMMLNR